MTTLRKKELETGRLKKRQQKEEKKAERKANSNKGKSLDTMLAYVDENGNISDTPPERGNINIIHPEDIPLDAPPRDLAAEKRRSGVVSHFDAAKGYGFINDVHTGERIFVHISSLDGPLKEHDNVTFDVAKGERGPQAVAVKAG
jgi:cold shock CspA family protein